ncbi:DNA cytosine methyltransferase [Thalassobaculum sp. OXR-137]|uniref:DNA cytosine methyltransferase n=1 Tax=Thalassobaculum sp. OXR-137 TaxID=3100173 RepID=UPI002AC98B68|nr:DNA cytosine methyltransferase [Thalassobaculum sp. OXR-137]WPZ35519.1 DNA cytosine methyltransferase [Thalassobaculum sp. OXR-137]
MSNLTAVSLFSGCGGFCEGVELAGFDLQCGVELDRFAAETYRHNFPRTRLFEGDVSEFLVGSGEEHRAKYGLTSVDLVFGGPPCQGYSQIGTRNVEDERNLLYKQYARIVDTLKPRMFLMENVPNLLLMQKGHFRDLIIKHFASLGYGNTTFLKVSSADFGVPQTRERVFFFGTRDDLEFSLDLRGFAENVFSQLQVKRPYTVWEAISDLPSDVVASGEVLPYPSCKEPSRFQRMMRLDYSAGPYTKVLKRRRGIGGGSLALHNHHTKEIQERRAHLISFLKPGAKADSLPKEIWNGKRPEKWRRLDPTAPSYTILAQMHRDLSEWVHPHLNRWITVREAARLQSFHDGFVFVGSEWQQLKQIGNAVPPLLGYAVARMAQQVLAAIEGDLRSGLPPVQAVLPGIAVAAE